jgi:hypothetical protein
MDSIFISSSISLGQSCSSYTWRRRYDSSTTDGIMSALCKADIGQGKGGRPPSIEMMTTLEADGTLAGLVKSVQNQLVAAASNAATPAVAVPALSLVSDRGSSSRDEPVPSMPKLAVAATASTTMRPELQLFAAGCSSLDSRSSSLDGAPFSPSPPPSPTAANATSQPTLGSQTAAAPAPTGLWDSAKISPATVSSSGVHQDARDSTHGSPDGQEERLTDCETRLLALELGTTSSTAQEQEEKMQVPSHSSTFEGNRAICMICILIRAAPALLTCVVRAQLLFSEKIEVVERRLEEHKQEFQESKLEMIAITDEQNARRVQVPPPPHCHACKAWATDG